MSVALGKYPPPLATDTEVNNCYIFCEQVYLSEFGVVLAVEPPALAGKKNGAEKSEPADRLFF